VYLQHLNSRGVPLAAHLTLLGGDNLLTQCQHANLSLYGRLIYLMYCLV